MTSLLKYQNKYKMIYTQQLQNYRPQNSFCKCCYQWFSQTMLAHLNHHWPLSIKILKASYNHRKHKGAMNLLSAY